MRAEVSAYWDGMRWFWPDVAIEVTEGANLMQPGSYTARKVSFAVQMDDALIMLEAGHDPLDLSFSVVVGGELYISGSGDVEFAEEHTTTLVTIADEPNEDESIVPPLYDARITFRDVAAEEARNFRQEQYQTFLDEARGPAKDLWANAYRAAGETTPNLIDDPNAPIYGQRVVGMTYPTIFGRPGRDGVPAYRAPPFDASSRYILIAGHRTTLGTVTIFLDGDEPMASQTYTTIHATDPDGRDVTVVQLDAAASDVIYNDNSTYYVAFNGTAAGMPSTGADVAIWLLSQTRGLRVDHASWNGARRLLEGYTLDTALDESASAWAILTATVLPILPIVLVATPNGVGCTIRDLRYDDRPTIDIDGKYALTAERVRPYSTGSGSVQIDFSLSAASGRFSRSAIATPRTHGIGPGVTKRTVIQSPWLYDQATAQRVAADVSTREAVRGGIYTGSVPAAMHGDEGEFPIRIGDCVRVMFGGGGRRALVTKIVRAADWLELELLIQYHPEAGGY